MKPPQLKIQYQVEDRPPIGAHDHLVKLHLKSSGVAAPTPTLSCYWRCCCVFSFILVGNRFVRLGTNATMTASLHKLSLKNNAQVIRLLVCDKSPTLVSYCYSSPFQTRHGCCSRWRLCDVIVSMCRLVFISILAGCLLCLDFQVN